MTCAWIETSSAETGSSSRISFGFDRQRPGDADALALSAGELVREAAEVLGPQADALKQLAALGLDLAPSERRAASAASPGSARMRLRGFSDACGSWKTICISRRIGCQLAALGLGDVLRRGS